MISSAARTQKICEGMTVLNVLFTDGGEKGNREETSVPKRQKARLFLLAFDLCVGHVRARVGRGNNEPQLRMILHTYTHARRAPAKKEKHNRTTIAASDLNSLAHLNFPSDSYFRSFLKAKLVPGSREKSFPYP